MPLVWVTTVLTMDLNSTLVTVSGLTLLRPLTVFFLSKLRGENAKFQNLVDLRDFHKKNSLKSQKLTTKNSIYINTNSSQSKNGFNCSFFINSHDQNFSGPNSTFRKSTFLKISNIKYYICAGISGLYKNYLTIKRSIK